MNNSKYNEIYDQYDTSSKSVIDCVTDALHTSLKTLSRNGNDDSYYGGKLHDLHQQAIYVRDLAEFISEYYYRSNVLFNKRIEKIDEMMKSEGFLEVIK